MQQVDANTRQAFRDQASLCDAMGSPFTASLCRLFAEQSFPVEHPSHESIARALYQWDGNPDYTADVLPLRVAGALHALVLTGSAPSLAACYPPNDYSDERLWSAILSVLQQHADSFIASLSSAPQTNEVQRSGVITAGLACLTELSQLPVSLLEIGASAGLNLYPDLYSIVLNGRQFGDAASPVRICPEWRGNAVPSAQPVIVTRAGCDLSPIHLDSEGAKIRLLSYVWADQHDRLQRVSHAIDVVKNKTLNIAQSDAGAWLSTTVGNVPAHRIQVVMHTVVWQYMSDVSKLEARQAIFAMGARADTTRQVAWFRLEADGSSLDGGALSLDYWDGKSAEPRHFDLGRADFHGRWIDWVGVH